MNIIFLLVVIGVGVLLLLLAAKFLLVLLPAAIGRSRFRRRLR